MRIIASIALSLLATTGGAAASLDDYSAMVAGNSVLELAETRQLTFASDGRVGYVSISPDGQSVVYTAAKDRTRVIGLVKTAGGKAATLLTTPSDESSTDPTTLAADKPVWTIAGEPVWSPNGKYIAFPGSQVLREGEVVSHRSFLIVLTNRGVQKAAIPLPGMPREGFPQFSPDSGKLLWLGEDYPAPESVSVERRVFVTDIERGVCNPIYSERNVDLRQARWDPGGESVLITAFRESGGETLHLRVHPDGRQDRIGEWKLARHDPRSSDGRFEVVRSEPGLALKEAASGRSRPLTQVSASMPLGWVPNSHLLYYTYELPVAKEENERVRNLHPMWLASADSQKLNRMLVARDFRGVFPSWSSDGLRVAYILDGAVHIAVLSRRNSTPREKLKAGLPLSREEELKVMTENGKEIGLALAMFAADWDDNLPTADYIQQVRDEHGHDLGNAADQALAPYMGALGGGKDAFRRPGTDAMVFRLIEPGAGKISDVEDPSQTVIGELDAGDGVIIQIFADGHVRQSRR